MRRHRVDVNPPVGWAPHLTHSASRKLPAFFEKTRDAGADLLQHSNMRWWKRRWCGLSARNTPPLSKRVHELLYFFQHASNNAASLVRGPQGTYLGMHIPRSLLCVWAAKALLRESMCKRYGLLLWSWRPSGGELELMSMTTRNSTVACQSGRESDVQWITRAEGSMSKDLRLLMLDPTAQRFVCNPHHTI
jgi:hypothetical protein